MRGKRVKALKSAACPNPGRKYRGTLKVMVRQGKELRRRQEGTVTDVPSENS